MTSYVTRNGPLAVLMTLLAMVPVATLGIVALDVATRSVLDRVSDGQRAVGHSLAQQAERDIRLAEERTARIVQRSGFDELVRARDADGLHAVLEALADDRAFYSRLAVYDRAGSPITGVPAGRPEVPAEGASSSVSESTVRVSEDRALAVLAFAVDAPAGRGGGSVGTLVAEIELGQVAVAVQEARFGVAGYATLTLADGKVIVTGDDAKSGRVLPGLIGDASLAGSQQETIERYRPPGARGEELATVTGLDNGWYLVVSQPRSEAFAPLATLRNTIIVAVAATLLTGALAALLLARVLRRAQSSILQSERRARQIVDVAHNAFMAIDQGGMVTEWNPAAVRLFGWTAEEAIGRSIVELVAPSERRDAYRGWIARLVDADGRGALDAPIEAVFARRDGDDVPVEMTISRLASPDGVEHFAFVRDISVRRQVERERADARRQLELANEELRAATEMKSDFLAMASHELRTPLTSISGFAKTLLELWSTLSEDNKREYVGIIDDQAERLGRLVTDLLLLARIERGAVHPDRLAVDLRRSINRVLRDLAMDVDVEVACPEDTTVLIDEDHFQQVLINLLSNASKYGREPFELCVRCTGAAGTNANVEITVADHGDGVPEDFVPRLFERFSQAPEHSTGLMGGAGLGLSIVAGLVHAHGGQVRYEPNEPRGARFIVRLPVD